ncbi:MAG: polysulfide reductase NrfD [Firmicutes bacterium]|nr:polysulfide reductase NrfD [Bacillota bacterium]
MSTVSVPAGRPGRNSWSWAAWTLWLAAAAFGGAGLIERLFLGERFVAYTSYVPWGMWVSAYIFFIGLSAGAFLLSSLVYVFGVRSLERIATLSLFIAAVTLAMALLSILCDLGHMERFWEVFTRPQLHSMMAWMVWLYTGYFMLLLAELYFALRGEMGRSASAEGRERDRRILRVLGAAGIPLAIAFHGGVGALFSTVAAREYWHSALYPILFLSGALLSGGALMTFVVAFFWPARDEGWRETLSFLSKLLLGLVLFDFLLEWAEYSIPAWYQIGAEYNLITYVFFGPFWYVFWIVHLAFGVIIPVLLLTLSKRPVAQGIAAALIAVTFFAVRLNLVIPGLISPELRGLQTAYLDPIGHRLSFGYVPSIFEWQVTIGVLAVGVALFYLGCRYLPLFDQSARVERRNEENA